jgi:hypothetical protein
MIGLTIISNLELGNLLVQNGPTNRILRHYPNLNLMQQWTFCLLILAVTREAPTMLWTDGMARNCSLEEAVSQLFFRKNSCQFILLERRHLLQKCVSVFRPVALA